MELVLYKAPAATLHSSVTGTLCQHICVPSPNRRYSPLVLLPLSTITAPPRSRPGATAISSTWILSPRPNRFLNTFIGIAIGSLCYLSSSPPSVEREVRSHLNVATTSLSLSLCKHHARPTPFGVFTNPRSCRSRLSCARLYTPAPPHPAPVPALRSCQFLHPPAPNLK